MHPSNTCRIIIHDDTLHYAAIQPDVKGEQVPKVAPKACRAFVEATLNECGGDFTKILIRPTTPDQVAVQYWPVGARDAEGFYLEVSNPRAAARQQQVDA